MQEYKKIIYLDQNFVSNLAKAAYLKNWEDPLADFFHDLNDLLVDLTSRNKLICPTSYFHKEESELGNRVKEFLWHFISELGYDLSLKNSIEIMESQILSAARSYTNLSVEQRPNWTIALNRDPQVPVGTLIRPMFQVDIPHIKEFNDYIWSSRKLYSDEYWHFKNHCRGKRKTYLDEIKAQKRQFVVEIFNPRMELNTHTSKFEQVSNLIGIAGVIRFHNSIYDILKHSNDHEGFFLSSHLLDCPYVHIWASLLAADIFFYPNKKPTKSLFTDFAIVASILPYVDVLTTDGYISELIQRAHLTEIFNARIFTIKRRQELVRQLQQYEKTP